MAHVAKFSKGAMGHMLGHYDRSKDGLGDNVDQSRSELNYNLAEEYQPQKQLDFIHQRLSEVRVQKRADVNVLCDWVVTAPKDLPVEELKPFFEAAHAFLAGKYGKENVVSAYVHMDETTPHLHFAFIPVVPDKRKGGFKVSAKECITRAELKTFHTDLQVRIEKDLGHPVAILNGMTRDGNKSIDDLKRQSAIERLQEVTEKASRIVSKTLEEVQGVKDNLIPLQAEYEAKRTFLREIDKDFDLTTVKENRNFFGKVKSYTVPKEVWETQTITRREAEAMKQAQSKWEKKMDKLHSTSILEQNGELRQEIDVLERKIYDLQRENSTLQRKVLLAEKKADKVIDRINKVLGKLPDEVADRFIKEWDSLERNRFQDQGMKR